MYDTILLMGWALQRLRRRESWSRARIEAYQEQALARLRANAVEHSPFYREFHAGLAERPLQELPILTRRMVHDQFDAIVTDLAIRREAVEEHAQTLRGAERFLGRYFVTTTSGTTGRATHFVYNHAEWATVLASFARFERHVGTVEGALRRPRMAVVASATPWHMSARIGATARSSLIPMLRLDVGEPLPSIVAQLNDWQPHVLATYATMAGILAGEQAAGRLHIAPVRIVCTAEMLSPDLRSRIQEVWGDIVFNQYGASEGGAFAIECDAARAVAPGAPRGLHLFEDLFVVEVVDRDNRPVAPGQVGDKVLLTVLFNHTQPLIRYELSDRLRLATESCACGCALALVEEIQGRREEVLEFPGRNGAAAPIHPMVFYRIFDAAPLADWQVVQEGHCLRLRLRLRRGPAPTQEVAPLEEALVAEVHAALVQHGIVVPEITVEWMDAAARGATGKATRILAQPSDPAMQSRTI